MKRALAVGAMAALCAGCIPATSATLATPSEPLTYRWTMVHDWDAWGVQIGPKSDGDGLHVAVYAWQNCVPVCSWEFFKEYDQLEPGSVHDYAIRWNGQAWDLSFDGRVLASLSPGGPSPAFVQTAEERTRA